MMIRHRNRVGLLMCGWYDDDAKPRDDRDGVSVSDAAGISMR
jgi:hypothetical protein